MKGSLSKPKIVIISVVLVVAAIVVSVCLADSFGPFKSSDVLAAASDCGMRSLTFEELQRRWDGGSFGVEEFENIVRSPAYFYTKDAAQANKVYAKYYEFDLTDVPGLDEFIECEAPKTNFDLFFIKTLSKESAKKAYDNWVKYWGEDEDTVSYSGKKRGCTYSIIYYPVEGGYRYFGMYLKGNTFVYIDTVVADGTDTKCLETFCKKLHLVSPVTSKK